MCKANQGHGTLSPGAGGWQTAAQEPDPPAIHDSCCTGTQVCSFTYCPQLLLCPDSRGKTLKQSLLGLES